MALIYKTLFEVKLLHEYYLTEKDGTTIFEKVLLQDRMNFLNNKYSFDLPSISDDMEFEIPEEAKEVFAGHRMRLLKSYSGFKVVIGVTKSIRADGSIEYRPLVSLKDDVN